MHEKRAVVEPKTDYKKAIFELIIHINPKNKDAYYNLGNTYETLGKTQQAIDCYQRAIHLSDYDLRLNPSDQKAYARQQSSLHLLNSLVGVTTKTAPKCYIKNLFDDFAQTFDHQLANVLDYKIPELLKNALLTQQGKNLLFNMAIDLGCGTGLSGQMFRPICKRLVGIDLSPKMIAKAREKKIYDIIENIEINDYLEQNSESEIEMYTSGESEEEESTVTVSEYDRIFMRLFEQHNSKGLETFAENPAAAPSLSSTTD